MAFLLSTTDSTDWTDECPVVGRNRSKSLLLSSGLRPCSPMRMLSHVSELPCLTLHICLICPGRRKPSKQNSCPWQYKMSLFRGYWRLPQTCQELALWLFFLSTTDLTDSTDFTLRDWKQDKNRKNPLERMDGYALLLCFRLGLIRASS